MEIYFPFFYCFFFLISIHHAKSFIHLAQVQFRICIAIILLSVAHFLYFYLLYELQKSSIKIYDLSSEFRILGQNLIEDKEKYVILFMHFLVSIYKDFSKCLASISD